MEDKIGSLGSGKDADIIAIKIDPITHEPLYNIPSQLVYTTMGIVSLIVGYKVNC